jgi:hypothetical protein
MVTYLVIQKYKVITPERLLASVTLALVCYYVVFPGIALHIWHKISSQNFLSALHYLIDRTSENKHVSVWNATALHDCGASVMHDFHMSEIFYYYQIKNVKFIPGPQYSYEDCAKAVQEFRQWQTKFFPDALSAYGEGNQDQAALVFAPESQMGDLRSILKKSGKDYKVVYSSEAGRTWRIFYLVIVKISKFTNDSPGYHVLEPSF